MTHWRKLSIHVRRGVGILAAALLYLGVAPFVLYIPNPMLPGGNVALNMIFPVLAGYFYGPMSGAVAGGLGTMLAGLIFTSPYDVMAILPHIVMGLAAGLAGQGRREALAVSTIVIGHVLNVIFFVRMGLMKIPVEQIGGILLGLAAETMIDVVAISLAIVLLQGALYEVERW